MLLLGFTGNGIELAGTLAHAAANADVPVDDCDLALIKQCLHGFRRAGFSTHHAFSALGIINLRQSVDHFNGLELTGLDASLASDTPGLAVGRDSLADARVMAGNVHLLCGRTQFQDMLRAGCNTLAAALALFFIHHSNMAALIHVNGTKRADLFAGSKTHAGKLAGLVAVGQRGCSNAVTDAVVFESCLAVVRAALADHAGNLLYAFTGLNTHNRRNFLGHFGPADRAGTDRCFPASNGICTAVAAGVSAAAAVGTGQCFTDCIPGGV